MVSENKRLLQRFRVPLGFLFAIVFVIFARPTLILMIAGGAVAVLGLLIRAWASGHIRKAQTLAVSGPYAYTRNPLYLGSLLIGAGFTIASGVWLLALLFIVLFLGIYFPVMNVESEDLKRIFGSEYEEYAGRVPLFFPRLLAREKSDTKFDFGLYLKYREYRAAIGLVVALGLLAAKMYFFDIE